MVYYMMIILKDISNLNLHISKKVDTLKSDTVLPISLTKSNLIFSPNKSIDDTNIGLNDLHHFC